MSLVVHCTHATLRFVRSKMLLNRSGHYRCTRPHGNLTFTYLRNAYSLLCIHRIISCGAREGPYRGIKSLSQVLDTGVYCAWGQKSVNSARKVFNRVFNKMYYSVFLIFYYTF